jgi:hypothetical protein
VEEILSLPVRWRDLTRDASLVLNVFCNDETEVRGTTLPLFDEVGRLRSGLQKLRLWRCRGDGGMMYKEMQNGESIDSFLDGGATPGIEKNDVRFHPFSQIDERKLQERDEKWKASLILHELNCASDSETQQAAQTLQRERSGSTSVSWLDGLTRQRCVDILNEPDENSLHINTGSINSTQSTAPTSSHPGPYLIIELPSPSIPILHEEPLYPVETSTHIRGTTGSITANELIQFHSKFRDTDDNRTKEGCGDLTVPITPRPIDPKPAPDLPLPQSFLYPLIQTLDYEPPLTDEMNEDNPFQDKYRCMAHDLIRGLVDPGLKPDRVQRIRLEQIINSPNHHLSTEEKDLLWKFRFSLVDNRRALTKFLLAVDWSVESEVVQAAELLEQWRKRSPIEVTDALKLLGRNVAFQTGLVSGFDVVYFS